nr:MAG TPA: ASCH domain protein [Caudoviricetes sp.]
MKRLKSRDFQRAAAASGDEFETLSSNFSLFRARRAASDGCMHALTVKPLWVWAILCGRPEFKDIENRSWNTKYRGPVLIHASKGFTEKEYGEVFKFIWSVSPDLAQLAPEYKTLMAEWAGRICGVVEISGVEPPNPAGFTSPWHMDGFYGFRLEKPRAFECKAAYRGALSFFRVEKEIVRAIKSSNAL